MRPSKRSYRRYDDGIEPHADESALKGRHSTANLGLERHSESQIARPTFPIANCPSSSRESTLGGRTRAKPAKSLFQYVTRSVSEGMDIPLKHAPR